MFESTDDLKAALGIDDFRRMSVDKVFDLVNKVQNGEVNDTVLATLLSVAPDTMAKVAQAIDDSTQKAVASNDQSSDNLFAQITISKRILSQIIENPSSSDEARQDALDRLERYDEKLFEHDLNNKRFNLEALKISKEAALGFATVVAVSAAAIHPESRKWLIQNGGKLLTEAARGALPGK